MMTPTMSLTLLRSHVLGCWRWTGTLVLMQCFTAFAFANPSTQDTSVGVKAIGTIDGAEKQIQSMYAKFAEWEQLVISSHAAADAGKRFPHQQLSKIFPETYRGIWYARHLQAMGEPAGYDLERKFRLLRTSMGQFALKLSEFQAQEIAKLTKETPARQKALAKIKQLADEDKLAEAERQIQSLHLDQLVSVFYLTVAQYKDFENEVNPPHEEILRRLNEQRRSTYQQQAMEKINAYSQFIETLQSESNRISTELQQSPIVTLAEGNRGDAADAIAYIATLWGNASAALTRSVAIAWAFNTGNAETTAMPYVPELRKLDSIASAALVGVLNAALLSTPSDQVSKLYPKLLIELSVIDRRYNGSLDTKINDSLTRLMAKNASLVEQSARYSAATIQPTRWMERFASQQADQQAAEFPPASDLLNREIETQESVQPAIYGPLRSGRQLLTPGTTALPASWLAGDANAMIGMKVREPSSLHVAGSAKLCMVPQDPRHYSNLPATFAIDRQLTELRSSLLLDETHGPLDLSAADAISSAEQHEFRLLGGQIQRLTVEPFVARFATLPNEAHALVPLNSLPSIDVRGNPIEQLIWRVDLQPLWVAHRMFYAGTE